MIRQTLAAASLAACAIAATAGAAAALDRTVTVINETTYAIVNFYASNVGADDWQEDILGADIIYPGEAWDINFDDGTGYCMFDFLAIFDDGEELVHERVNICEISTYRFYE